MKVSSSGKYSRIPSNNLIRTLFGNQAGASNNSPCFLSLRFVSCFKATIWIEINLPIYCRSSCERFELIQVASMHSDESDKFRPDTKGSPPKLTHFPWKRISPIVTVMIDCSLSLLNESFLGFSCMNLLAWIVLCGSSCMERLVWAQVFVDPWWGLRL